MTTAEISSTPPESNLLQEIELLLREPDAPYPAADTYFRGTPLPECSYAFWTEHAQARVTQTDERSAPDPTLPETKLSWSWA